MVGKDTNGNVNACRPRVGHDFTFCYCLAYHTYLQKCKYPKSGHVTKSHTTTTLVKNCNQ